MKIWNISASENTIQQTADSLKQNGINTVIVDSLESAKKIVLEMIPEGSEVHTNTSITLDESGISRFVNESGKYNATKPRLMLMNRQTEGLDMNKLGSGPEWVIGSVHAVTVDGRVMIASGSGSNLPSYAYGASHVIWVVGAQKIVKGLDDGFKRIYQHSLPLENKRAKKAYGTSSNARKLLIFNSEGTPGRITMIIVKEPVGF